MKCNTFVTPSKQSPKCTHTRTQGRLQQARAAARGAALAGCGGNRLRTTCLRATHWLSDNARHALILLVFGFKGLEWWFTAAEGRLGGAGKALPLPPPPPPPLPAPAVTGGVGLPADPACCPVCRQQTVNPAQLATSGYVGCYACLFAYVAQHGVCPVTRVPTTTAAQHVRKLYDGS
jgi:peroxin-12